MEEGARTNGEGRGLRDLPELERCVSSFGACKDTSELALAPMLEGWARGM
jgi:hypothetical protein